MDRTAPAATGESSSSAVRDPKPPRRWGFRLLAVVAVVALASAGVYLALGSRLRWAEPSLARAEALLEEKRFAEAEREAQALLEARPNEPGALIALARARIGAGDLAGGVEALELVPSWSMRKSLALFFQGQALLKLGLGRKAERVFQEAATRPGPLATSARIELMALYAMEERFDEFRRTFWELFPLTGETERLPLLTLRMRGEFEQVEASKNAESVRRLLKGDPTDYHAKAGLAATMVHAEDLPKARQLYREALAESPEDPEILEGYLDVLHRLGDTTALIEAVKALPADLPDRPELQMFQGIAAQEQGDLEAAARAFERAVSLDPDEPEYHHRLAQVLTLLGRRDQARAEAETRNRLNQANDRLRKAWDAFIIAYESDPQSVTVEQLDGMARACRASGLTREADAWERQARRLEQIRRQG